MSARTTRRCSRDCAPCWRPRASTRLSSSGASRRGNVELVRAAWERFSQGDLRVVERTLDPQVRWYGAGDPDGEGGCQNREEALAFIRSALANGTTVRLLDIHDAGDRLVLTLQRNRRP